VRHWSQKLGPPRAVMLKDVIRRSKLVSKQVSKFIWRTVSARSSPNMIHTILTCGKQQLHFCTKATYHNFFPNYCLSSVFLHLRLFHVIKDLLTYLSTLLTYLDCTGGKFKSPRLQLSHLLTSFWWAIAERTLRWEMMRSVEDSATGAAAWYNYIAASGASTMPH